LTADKLVLERSGGHVTLHFTGYAGGIYLDRQFDGWDYGVEQIVFGDGATWSKSQLQTAYLGQSQTAAGDVLWGFSGNDTMQGGTGDDRLYGYAGTDTYTYNAGDGNDRIYEDQFGGNGDRLVLGAGLTTDKLVFERSGNHATLRFAGYAGGIYLDQQFGSNDYGVEQIVFGDGMVWTKQQLLTAYNAYASSVGGQTFNGTAGSDTLQGGSGDDVLVGNGGNDTYVYNAGGGNDRIFEGLSSGNGDRLSLGAGLTADILTFDRVGTSVTLHFAAQSGSIYLDRQFEGFDNGVEQIAFANGTIWTKADLQSAYWPASRRSAATWSKASEPTTRSRAGSATISFTATTATTPMPTMRATATTASLRV
jgi:Ca2+-binding RTX toxin-like protein